MEDFEACLNENGQQMLDSHDRPIFYCSTTGELMVAVGEIPNTHQKYQGENLDEDTEDASNNNQPDIAILSKNCQRDAENRNENLETWNKKKLMLLIERRLAMESIFQNPTCKKAKCWSQIQISFEKQGYSVTAAELAAKWKNMMVTYTRNVDKLRKTGESAITWEYFEIIHEALCKQKSVCPPAASLGSTFTKGSRTETAPTSLQVACHSFHSLSSVQPCSVPVQKIDKLTTATPQAATTSTDNSFDTCVENTSSQSTSLSPCISKRGQKRSAQIQDSYGLLRDEKNEELDFKKLIWQEERACLEKNENAGQPCSAPC